MQRAPACRRPRALVRLGVAAPASAAAATATVTWQTSAPTRGQVAYGVGGLYLYSARESAATTTHSITLQDLAPSTTYSFRAGSATGQVTQRLPRFRRRLGSAPTARTSLRTAALLPGAVVRAVRGHARACARARRQHVRASAVHRLRRPGRRHDAVRAERRVRRASGRRLVSPRRAGRLGDHAG